MTQRLPAWISFGGPPDQLVMLYLPRLPYSSNIDTLMTADSILPDLQAAILCEDVRAEISGQQTLIGVIGAIPTPTLPIAFFKLCLWTRWCGGSGDFIQKCLIYDPEEDQPIAQAEIPFSLTDLNAHATNVHFFGGVQFQKFGTYHVEILIDDEIRLRIPLPVIEMEIPPQPGHR